MPPSPTNLTPQSRLPERRSFRPDLGLGRSVDPAVTMRNPGPGEKLPGPPPALETFSKSLLSASGFQLATLGFGLLLLMLLASAGSFWAGMETGSVGTKKTSPPPLAAAQKYFPESALDRLDGAMAEMRLGNAALALESIKGLRAEFPDAPMLDYALALAALQARDFALAEIAARRSAERGERKSDSLALVAAALASNPSAGTLTFSGASARDLELLREAIAADPLNPGPRIELAGKLRAEGDTAGAARQLRAARNLLLPVDSAIAIDVTLALMEPENAGTAGLPATFAAALKALSAGDPQRATELLETAKSALPPDTFAYLVGDPAFAHYADAAPFEALSQSR